MAMCDPVADFRLNHPQYLVCPVDVAFYSEIQALVLDLGGVGAIPVESDAAHCIASPTDHAVMFTSAGSGKPKVQCWL